MFMGEYNHTIDEKNRLIIPSKFRNQLGEQFVITRWLEKSLHGFPLAEWEKLVDKLSDLPVGASDARAFERLVMSGAAEVEFDKQGRILIPNNLVDYAQVEKETIVIGTGSGFEIWSQTNWNQYNDAASAKFEEIAEGLTDFDL